MGYINEPYARFRQSTVEEIQGKSAFDLYPPEQAQEYIENNRAVLRAGQVQELLEAGVAPDGTRVAALVYKFPIQDAAGRALVGGIAIDRSEREKLEAQLHHAQRMESVGRLAGGIAHDFNNLLAVILGYAELMGQNLPEDAVLKTSLANIQLAAHRSADLTRQLLTFARKQAVAPIIIEPNAILKNMLQMLRPLLGMSIELVTRFDEQIGLIRVDPRQLEQVIVNLIVNARDAMPDGGTLFLQTELVTLQEASLPETAELPAGKYMRLTLRDTGLGMTEDVRAHIFEPFFTTKEAGKGTGLGLAICYGIVKQNDGFIQAESEVGVGTTFKVYFPCVETAEYDGQADASLPDDGHAPPGYLRA